MTASKRYTAGRYLSNGTWEYVDFDRWEDAKAFVEGYSTTNLVLNEPVSGDAISAALAANRLDNQES